MDKYHVNLSDFDLELFLIGKKLVIESTSFEVLERVCEQFSKKRTPAFVIAEAGTGIENFLERRKDKHPESVFVVDCFRCTNLFAELAIQIGLGHKNINWFDTPISNIVEGLVYFLGKTNNRTLIVFNHCDTLKLPPFAELLFQCSAFSGLASVMYRITPAYGEKIEKCTDPKLRHFAAIHGKLGIDFPTEANLSTACHKNGIISAAVVAKLIKDTLDFDVVASRVDTLRNDVKAFIQQNGQSN